MENLFEFVRDIDNKKETTNEEVTDSQKIITAFQIIRVVKSSGGFSYRNILDTLKVGGDVEHTRQRANGKAQRLGTCMVVELSEKVVSVVD